MTDSKSGILKLANKGAGLLLDPTQLKDDVFVPAKLIRDYSLPAGAIVAGPVRRGISPV